MKNVSETLYHGTYYNFAKKILEDGFIYPSLSKEVKGLREKIDLVGYENLMNGVYLTNKLQCARNFGGGGPEQVWGVEDGEYQNFTCKNYCIVLVFDNLDISNFQFGEKTLNYFVFDKETKQWTGEFCHPEWNPYDWEDLKADDEASAIEVSKFILNNVSIEQIKEEIKDYLGRNRSYGIDIIIPNKMSASSISSIKIYYAYNEFVESSVANLDNDINLIRTMQHPDIDWEEII